MKRLTAEFAKGALAALALLGAACTTTAHARSERASVAPAEPMIQAPAETSVANSPGSGADAKSSELERQPAPSADAGQASNARAIEERALETPKDEGAAPVASQAGTPVMVSVPSPELPELWRFDRGPGEVALMVPRDEMLVFEVHLNLGWLGSPDVGKVTMSSEVKPFYSDVLGHAAGEQALLTGRAEGGYKVYTLDNRISAALLPQAWPRLVHRNVQTGTENRTRELMFGVQDNKEVSSFRGDGHCKGCKEKAHFVSSMLPWRADEHCKKCKLAEHRVWKETRTREVPAGTFDMMTAVFLARSMVLDGRDRMEFPLVDRNDLWQVQLRRGKTKTIETSAGKFKCVAIELRTSAPEKTPAGEATKFEGLFGIHGTISIWMEASSGVPVRIDGTVPAGPIELDATIELRSARGAPRSFATLH